MVFQVVFDWGDRSRNLQARLKQKVAGASFWLMPAVSPVQLGIVAPQDVGRWEVATTVPLTVTTELKRQTATTTVPDGMSHVRLDFDLSTTIDGQTASVLSFQQLFLATSSLNLPGGNATGTLLPVQFCFADKILTPSPTGPVAKLGPSATGRRNVLGLHPLVNLAGIGRFIINAEFVDATELWWKLHPDTTWGWYWHPEVKGRQEHLRVLAWTGGGNPMIWFAVIPDAAVPLGTAAPSSPGKAAAPADIVYFRPPPGRNAFVYSPDAKGFANKTHDDTTLSILARYLLSPIPEATFLSLQTSRGVRTPELLADQVQPKATTPIAPEDPMFLMKLFDSSKNVRNDAFTDGMPNAFRPVGLEAAVNRTGIPHVLFLPLGFSATASDPPKPQDNPQGGYEAALVSGLKTTIQSALTVLWNANAVGRDKTVPTTATERQLWVAGHSEGNRSAWACLENNARDIERIISFDSDTLVSLGIPAMKTAGNLRMKTGQTLDALVIITPANGGANGLTDEQDVLLRQLRKKGTLVTVLPNFDQRAAYWHLKPRPPAITNPFFLHLLAKWSIPTKTNPAKTLLDVSADSPGNWGFLFFHELAVFGGDLIQPPASAPSNTPPTLRTFFEQALGPPNPLPPP